VTTWRESVFSPASFFRAMPVDRGIGAAVVYFLIVGIAASAIEMFWQLTLRPLLDDEAGPLLRLLLGTDEAPLVSFLLSPVFLLVSLGIAAVIVHFCLWIAGGAKRTMGTTTRVIAYAYGPQLFAVVPILGTLVGSIWIIVISIIGVREAHATDGWRAGLAVLLPFFALLLVGMLLALVLAGMRDAIPGLPG
jgi:hypothetical protein